MDGLSFEDLKKYFIRYENFVKLNPRLSADVEAILRWSSYLIASKKSPVIGELLSSSANLLQLCNDILLRQASPELKLDLANHATQLKTSLCVIQSLELFAEIYARETYGNIGKWAIITIIQITKSAIRLALLLIYNDGLTKHQAIVPLDRGHYIEINKLTQTLNEYNNDTPTSSIAFDENEKALVLKSSGRRIRSINEPRSKNSPFRDCGKANNPNDPFAHLRQQKLMMLLNRYKEIESTELCEKQLCGEVLHITRPVAHLALMAALGSHSWIPYMAAMAMDVSSLYLVRQKSVETIDGVCQIPRLISQFHMKERIEIGQRASSILLYLLRSPFFDKYTKTKALEGLKSVGGSIPIFNSFFTTFVDYIPEWQKDYFRVWS